MSEFQALQCGSYQTLCGNSSYESGYKAGLLPVVVYCVSGRDFGDLTRRCMAILVLVLVVAWVSDQPHLGGGLDVHGPCTQPRNMV